MRDEDTQPAIILDGTYTRTDNTTSPIQFRFNSGEVFEAETSQQVTVNEDEEVLARIVFDPDVWFSVVSTDALDNATVNNDGVIVISEDSNSAIFDLVADRLDLSTQSVFDITRFCYDSNPCLLYGYGFDFFNKSVYQSILSKPTVLTIGFYTLNLFCQ